MLYNEAWNIQEERISRLLEDTNTKVIDGIEEFIEEPWENDENSRVSTALVLPGSNIANHIRLFSQINDRIAQRPNLFAANINSKDCPNLKSALKMIVLRLTEDEEKGGDLEDGENDLRFDKRLRYDFDILIEWCKRQVRLMEGVQSLADIRVVVSIQDGDSFDVSTLSRVIVMMQSYISQIPFKLMINIATSLEVFQAKLKKSCIKLISGTPFYAQISDGITKILDETIFKIDSRNILLSPELFRALIDRQRNSMDSLDSLVSSIKYTYMAHYYANPFSILSQCGMDSKNKQYNEIKTHLNAKYLTVLRMLPSFKSFIERKKTDGESDLIRKLLNDDKYLMSIIPESLVEFRDYMNHLLSAMDLVMTMQESLPVHHFTKISLYELALTGELWNLSLFKDLLNDFRDNLDFDQTIKFMDGLKRLEKRSSKLKELRETLEASHDRDLIAYASSKNKSKSKFTAIVLPMAYKISDFLLHAFGRSYRHFFLYELFVADIVNLQGNVFIPTQRAAIEVGLFDPQHYWGDLLDDNPHISTLYQLYCEASVFINTYDFYNVFKNTLAQTEPIASDDPQWDQKTMAWFLQGVAELRLLGVLRDSKRKYGCLEKVLWKDI